MERWALYVTLLVLVLLLAGFAFRDLSELLDSGRFRLPPLPQRSLWEMVTIVAGTLIVVQGFETPRYLGAQFNSETRIRASRWSQYLSLSVYIAFALYYLLQCRVALSVCRNHRERARFFLVALVLGFVLLFAVPAG